jgi:hypothetical protein
MLAEPMFRHYTDHTIEHSQRIILLASDLIKMGNITLSQDERFVLLCAIVLHDIGMQTNEYIYGKPQNPSDNELEIIREKHHEYSYNLIIEHYNDYGLQKQEGLVDFIAQVAKNHRKTNLETETKDVDYAGKPLRLKLLSVIIRLSDCLDFDHRRVNIEKLSHFNVSPESKTFWFCHYYVQSLKITEKKVKLVFRFPNLYNGTNIETSITRYAISEIEDQIDKLYNLLAKYNITFHKNSVESDIVYIDALKELPEDVIKYINDLPNSTKLETNTIPSEDEENAKKKYLAYLEYECIFDVEGLPVPQEVLDRKIALEETFVPLRFVIIPEKWDEIKSDFDDSYINIHKDWFGLKCPVSDMDDKFNNPFRAVIFSGPGGGKTTYMRRLVSAYGLKKFDNVKDNLPKRPLFPILIKCRDFEEIGDMAILDIIQKIPQKIGFAHEQRLTNAFYQLVIKQINNGYAMILFDGLDEIKDASSRSKFINQVKRFADEYKNVNIVMSSRLVGFKQITNNLFASFHRWLILPFNKKEIEHLCICWHQILFPSDEDFIKSAKKLSDAILSNDRIYKLAQVPILLTTLLLVNKQHGGRLPIRRTELYSKAIEVLLNTWGVAIRKSIDPRKALPHLAYLAHKMMFGDGSQKIGETKLLDILNEAQRNLERYSLYSLTASNNDSMFFKDTYDFIDKIEDRSSLLVNRGYRIKEGSNQNEREYEFLHLTFQEFLTAYAIINRHYPKASDNSNINDCFEGNWENPTFKEVILLTSVLTDGWGASKMIQKILKRLEDIKISRILYRQSTVTYLKNLMLQMIMDEALLTTSDREKIYKTCFSAPVEANIFRSEFLSLYESEHRDEMLITLKQLDQERKYPLYAPLFQLLEERMANPAFSLYFYYKKIKKNNGPLKAVKILDIATWLGWDLNPRHEKKEFKGAQVKKELKDELSSYCMMEDEKLAYFAYKVLYRLCNDNDPILSGKLLQSLLRFSSESDITQHIDKFSITQDTLIFLRGNSLTEVQIKALDEAMKQEIDTQNLIQHFKFGILCGAWDITIVIKKANEFHHVDYITKEDSYKLFIWMQRYLSVLKETESLTTDQKILAEKYQYEVGGLYNETT